MLRSLSAASGLNKQRANDPVGKVAAILRLLVRRRIVRLFCLLLGEQFQHGPPLQIVGRPRQQLAEVLDILAPDEILDGRRRRRRILQ
jgi:hypothetical protein